MVIGAKGLVWGKGSQAPRVSRKAPLQSQIRSNSSSTNAQIVTQSGQYSTSTEMKLSCHRHPVLSAASATHQLPLSLSKLWSTIARGARNGIGCVFPRNPFHSKCTTSPWPHVIAASVERFQWASSWTYPAVYVGVTSANSGGCGPRMVTKSRRSAIHARPIKGPLLVIRRRRLRNRQLTWSIAARTASRHGLPPPRNCCRTRVWQYVPFAAGSGIQRLCPKGNLRRRRSNNRPKEKGTSPRERSLERGPTDQGRPMML